MLTPEQIDSRMAELGDVFWMAIPNILKDSGAKDIFWKDLEFRLIHAWERMKDVAEQAKKARGE